MRKHIIFFCVLIWVIGCERTAKEDKQTLAKINNYEITLAEFEAEFKESPHARDDTLESRKEFLNNLTNRKLILQDAQNKGLDKDKSFLKIIERFWEQSLLKLALDRKTKELAGSVFVSDKEIEEVYSKMKSEGKTDKSYDQMYSQIKWEIQKAKETQRLNQWLEALRKNSNIKVNYDLLKSGK